MAKNDPGEVIKEYLTQVYGETAFDRYFSFMQTGYTTTLRVNTVKAQPETVRAHLLKYYGITVQPHPFLENAFQLPEHTPSLAKTFDHIFGNIYIQSTSSMLPPLVLNPQPGERVLDLCAAPGSKTTQMAAMMNNKGTLVANEISADRVKALVFNLERSSIANFATVHGKGEELSKMFEGFFDKILVDAPCSGLGILQRKGDDVSDWWSPESVLRLQEVQYRLLISAYKMLRPGGTLVYSTCTLTIEENEDVISRIMEKCDLHPAEIELPVPAVTPFASFNGTDFNQGVTSGKRILPWQANSEGFFVIKLVRGYDDEDTYVKHKIELGNDYKASKEIYAGARKAFEYYGMPGSLVDEYKLFVRGDDVFFIPVGTELPLSQRLNRIGLKFADTDKYGNVLLHSQAIQFFKDKITDHITELQTNEEAATYINGGIIKSINHTRGQTAVKYKDYILGAGKITEQGLKSSLPRGVRAQAIQLPI